MAKQLTDTLTYTRFGQNNRVQGKLMTGEEFLLPVNDKKEMNF